MGSYRSSEVPYGYLWDLVELETESDLTLTNYFLLQYTFIPANDPFRGGNHQGYNTCNKSIDNIDYVTSAVRRLRSLYYL